MQHIWEKTLPLTCIMCGYRPFLTTSEETLVVKELNNYKIHSESKAFDIAMAASQSPYDNHIRLWERTNCKGR